MRFFAALLLVTMTLFVMLAPAHAGGTSNQIVAAVNQIRNAHGLRPLAPHPALQRAATQQSRLMARTGRMAHTAAPGYSFSRRLNQVGYRGLAAENIARGHRSLGQVLTGWLGSRGHRRNMLHPRMRYFGLSAVKDSRGRTYWAMVLGG